MRDLALTGAVGVHHPEIHLQRPHEVAGQKVSVARAVGRGGGVVRAVHDELAVGREERSAVIAEGVGQPAQAGAVGAHRVDVEIAVPQRGEDDRAAVGRQRAFRVVARRGREAAGVGAVGIGDVDVVVVQGPDVALRVIGARRAGGSRMLGAGIEDAAVVIEEISAGVAPFAARDRVQVRAVGVHDVDVIAATVAGLALQDEAAAVGGPIGLGILPAEGELAEVAQVDFAGVGSDGLGLEREEVEDSEHGTGNLMRNAECGMRNCSGQVIPQSAFRIPH